MSASSASSFSPRLQLARIVETTQAQLFGFVRGLIRNGDEARDVVQDVFVDAWKAAAREKPPFGSQCSEAEVRKWLFHVAYCKAMSYLRHDRVINWESLDANIAPGSNAQDVSSFEARIVDAETVRAAMATLEPADSLCITLGEVLGFTSVEIAQILDITPEAARKRLSRALQRLRAAYFAHENSASPVPLPQPTRHIAVRKEEMWK